MSIWIEVIEPFTVREHGQVSSWQAGQRMILSLEKAQRVIERVGNKVRVVEPDTMDRAIGTVVEASMDFLNEDGTWVNGVGPWIIADVVVVDCEPGLLPGCWLLLSHGSHWRWSHESKTAVYYCPNCKTSRCWWSEHTVRCAECVPPTCPCWRDLWREIAELAAGITADDLRHAGLLDALHCCDEAFRLGDYAAFQAGVIRVRRAAQGPTSTKK